MIKFSDIGRITEIKNILDNLVYVERSDRNVITCQSTGVVLPKEHAILSIDSYRKSLVTELETYGIKYDK